MKRAPRLTREYPTFGNGVPIPFHELGLPQSNLDLTRQDSFNNHHWCFTAREFGRLAITQTFRDLAAFQSVEPKDTHMLAHYLFDQPKKKPELITMMDIIDQQRAVNGLLRYGSANHPIYKGIDDELWHTLNMEYNYLNEKSA